MAYNSRRQKAGPHGLPVLLSSRLTRRDIRLSCRPLCSHRRSRLSAVMLLCCLLANRHQRCHTCGNTVGAVIPTARASGHRSYTVRTNCPSGMPLPDLPARGLYRRSGFSPCPEDMRYKCKEFYEFRATKIIFLAASYRIFLFFLCDAPVFTTFEAHFWTVIQ